MNGAPKYQDLILDAIDQLRHRKARPDAERIYNCLFRRHSVSCNDARAALEKCVETGVVLRVCYKGNISYRNAAKKFSHLLKRGANGELIRVPGRPRRKFTALLTNTFAELVMRDPDYLDQGVPAHELISTILDKDSVRYTKRYVSILLEKEVETGGLVRLETTGNYIVGPNITDRRQQIPMESLATETRKFDLSAHAKFKKSVPRLEPKPEKLMEPLKSDGKSGDNLRVGGRRKKAKKVFDPSDNNLPRKRGRPVGSLNKATLEKQIKLDDEEPEPWSDQNGREQQQGGVCSVCHEKKIDRMVSCRECSNKAHSTCLINGNMMLRMNADNTWQCPQCKTCVVCYETSDAGSLIVCSVCSDSYHQTCHQPNVRSEKAKNSPKWKCRNCQSPEELAVDRIQIGYNMETAKLSIANVEEAESPSPVLTRNSSPAHSSSLSPTPPTLSPQVMQNGRNPSPTYTDSKSDMSSLKDERIDVTIPDATNWSPDDVYQYFRQYFPEEASVFKEQEIDGHSLLLMKRMDVLKGLALKLGPALKIYRHVLKLQYRRDDPKLYWV